MLVTANAKIITAEFAIKIIVERSLFAVLKKNADKAGAANEDRGHFFYNDPTSPFPVIGVEYLISQAEI